ncbi:MAG: hypothetical protein EOP83_06545 [Verrucomicrobiaceae bacterium]|nr:MAG: hypothetical protein EOP83_06545 [Verrucomicrobiaceae bacterium]
MRYLFTTVAPSARPHTAYPYVFAPIVDVSESATMKSVRTYLNISTTETSAWCREHFGPADRLDLAAVERRWKLERVSRKFYLRYEYDALEFKLRWC